MHSIGARAWIATIACVIPLAVGFLIPVLLLVRLYLADPGAVDTGRIDIHLVPVDRGMRRQRSGVFQYLNESRSANGASCSRRPS